MENLRSTNGARTTTKRKEQKLEEVSFSFISKDKLKTATRKPRRENHNVLSTCGKANITVREFPIESVDF